MNLEHWYVSASCLPVSGVGWAEVRHWPAQGSGPRTGIGGRTKGGNRSLLTLTHFLTCRHTALPPPSNTKLIRSIMTRNAKKDRNWTYRRYPHPPSRRQLRTTMMMPVIYEQLKWEKLKIQKARCVCVRAVLSGSKGWATRGTLAGLGSHLGAPTFIL